MDSGSGILKKGSLPGTGCSQHYRVLHQMLLIILRTPESMEGALLVPPCRPDQADYRGSQQDDQDHHEQPCQDHHWRRERGLRAGGMRTAMPEWCSSGLRKVTGALGAQGKDPTALVLHIPPPNLEGLEN